MWAQTAFWPIDLAMAMACSSDDDDDDDGRQASVQQLVRKIRRSSAPKLLFLARGSPFRKMDFRQRVCDVTFDRAHSWAAIRQLCASVGKTQATAKGNLFPPVQALGIAWGNDVG